MENHSPETEKKPYFFKKDPDVDDGAGGIKKGKFKAYDTETNELLIGYENMEFGSPLEGGRFMFQLLRALDKKAEEASENVQRAPAPGIPIIGDISEIHIVGGCKYVEISIHEQDDSAKRKDILVTDGVSRDFLIQYDTKVIVPEGVQTVLGECVYTQMVCIYDAKEGKAWIDEKDVPRFSIQFHRVVPQEEAEEWLAGMKRKYVKI